MNKKNVYILSGIPAAGKSTWVRANMTPDSEWISRDNVRFSIVREDEDYFSHEDEVFDTFIAYINQTLENPNVNTIYIDATHLNKWSRNKTLRRIKKNNIKELNCVCFMTPLAVCQERNNQRVGRLKVPETAINNMFKSFAPPSSDENFDNVYFIDEWGSVISG